MSTLSFNGQNHQITMTDSKRKTVGTWPAYNNVDSHASLRHLDNATYTVQDTTVPHAHPADPNGPFGSYGIIRFNVPGHTGIGVHSGEANASRRPGPPHWTMGCTWTSDEAMHAISGAMKTDPLTTIEVIHNDQPAATSASLRQRHRRVHAHAPVSSSLGASGLFVHDFPCCPGGVAIGAMSRRTRERG